MKLHIYTKTENFYSRENAHEYAILLSDLWERAKQESFWDINLRLEIEIFFSAMKNSLAQGFFTAAWKESAYQLCLALYMGDIKPERFLKASANFSENDLFLQLGGLYNNFNRNFIVKQKLSLKQKFYELLRNVAKGITEIYFDDLFLYRPYEGQLPWIGCWETIKFLSTTQQQMAVFVAMPAVTGQKLLEIGITPLLESLYPLYNYSIEENLVDYPSFGGVWDKFIRGILSEKSQKIAQLQEKTHFYQPSSIRKQYPQVAQVIGSLLMNGYSPNEIAIVVPPHHQEQLTQILHDYQIPIYQPKRIVNYKHPLLQAVLRLYEIAELNFPLTMVCELWQNKFFRQSPAISKMQEFFQQSGQGGNKSIELQTYLDHLSTNDVESVKKIVEFLQPWFSLPAEAMVTDHAKALQEFLTKLWVGPKLNVASSEAISWQLHALANEQWIWKAIHQTLQEIITLPCKMSEKFSRLVFIKFFLRRVTEHLQKEGGWKENGVILGEMDTVVGYRCRHIIFTDFFTENFPGSLQEDPWFSDQDKRAINKILEKNIFTPHSQDLLQFPVLWVWALANAESASFFFPSMDESGKLLESSLYLEEIRKLTGPVKILSLPELGCFRLPELWAKAASEQYLSPTHLSVLWNNLAQTYPSQAKAIDQAISIEQFRREWFAQLQTNSHLQAAEKAQNFLGKISPDILAQRYHFLPGTKQNPLSVSALEDYAQCPFRFFARSVLHLEQTWWAESNEELEPVTWGQMQHELLRKIFQDRLYEQELSASDIAHHIKTEFAPNPLIEIQLQKLAQELSLLIKNEKQWSTKLTPHAFEYQVGPFEILPKKEQLSAKNSVYIKGVIDRLDIGNGKALILDYKSGNLEYYQTLLQKEQLHTSFQLPLYVAALQNDPVMTEHGITEVRARYYSISQCKLSKEVLNDQPELLKERVHLLVKQIHEGNFMVSPKSCDGCKLENICRIPQKKLGTKIL